MYIKMNKKLEETTKKLPTYIPPPQATKVEQNECKVCAHYCEQRKSQRYLLPTAALSHVAAAVVIPCTR